MNVDFHLKFESVFPSTGQFFSNVQPLTLNLLPSTPTSTPNRDPQPQPNLKPNLDPQTLAAPLQEREVSGVFNEPVSNFNGSTAARNELLR